MLDALHTVWLEAGGAPDQMAVRRAMLDTLDSYQRDARRASALPARAVDVLVEGANALSGVIAAMRRHETPFAEALARQGDNELANGRPADVRDASRA